MPASGRNPTRKRNSRTRRSAPRSAAARKRKLSKVELTELETWLRRAPHHLVANLYKGLGGQPGRVASDDRMFQLTVRAIAQGSRVTSLLKQLHERDRKSLSALVQAGGVAQSEELVRELILSYGGHEREWQRSLTILADRGLVTAAAKDQRAFFYVVPAPLVDGIVDALSDDMTLPSFDHDEMRVTETTPFAPPLEFSITSLATYIDHHAPRLTQRHDIYRADQEEMDAFFAQLWKGDSELFTFHLDFLMMHGMVELRGEYLALDRDVMEEWLRLEPEDQRDLIFRALERRFPLAEWVLWTIHATGEEGWVPERPLAAMYRRWKKGEDWRERFTRGQTQAARSSDRESYSFSPLVNAGLLEMGQWGQEKFYRLSPRGRHLLEPAPDDGFRQFYLTPSFEIMAPAGLAPSLLFRIGELAELTGCDRANTYKITEPVIEKALERGWRRDDVLQFLRENSQIGLPDNVEQTLKGWIGHRGDVEFHELTLLTVHRSQIRRLEGNKRVKPYLLHRFAPGMYAIDPAARGEITAVLQDSGFDPAHDTRRYPGDPEQVEARAKLRLLVSEAREAAREPTHRGKDLVEPEALEPVPGTKLSKAPAAQPDRPPEVEPHEVRELVEQALAQGHDLEMVYRTRTGQALPCRVQPQRLALKADAPVLVGLDREEDERRTFLLERIERLAAVETP